MIRILSTLALLGALASASLAQAAPPVEVYGKLPAVDLVSLSPSGERYAFVGVEGEKRTIIISATADNKLLGHADMGDAKLRGIQWAGEDHVLITVTTATDLGMDFTTHKTELATVVVFNLAAHNSFTVFKGNDSVANSVQGSYGVAQVGGHWYGYFGGITYAGDNTIERVGGGQHYLTTTDPDLYRVDLDTGHIAKVAPASPVRPQWLVGPDGEVIARSTYNAETGEWAVRSGARGAQPLIGGKDDFGGVTRLERGRTPGQLLIDEPLTVDHSDVLKQLPEAGGAATVVAGYEDIDEPIFDRVTGLWIGNRLYGDEPIAELFNPTFGARLEGARKAFPGHMVRLDSWNTDFTRMIMFTTGGDDSGTYWLVDIAKGSARPFGYAYPAIKPEDVGPSRMVDWKAADGLALRGVLTLPPGAAPKNLPLVVLPHGGPEARDYARFDWWAQAFAARGYAVFQPNFRGSGDLGVAFRNAGFGQWGRKMQTDVSDGVAELARQGIADPKRACIVGASYGGYAALAGVTVQHGLYRCAVSVAGVSDPAGMVRMTIERGNGPDESTRYWKTFMGVTTVSDPALDAISPLKLAACADAPILLIHGKDDIVVPPAQSETMEAALRAAGKPVELIWMPDEDHWLSREATRTLMLKSAVAFVEKYNPADAAPGTSPHPAQ